MEKFSKDGNFYYRINERAGLLRIEYFINAGGVGDASFVPICGTNASVFDDMDLVTKEAERMLKKYEENPNLFRG